MVILLNNAHGEISANTAFAFLAGSNDGNSVLHGFKEGGGALWGAPFA